MTKRNPIARNLRTPTYRQRVVPSKRKFEEALDNYIDDLIDRNPKFVAKLEKIIGTLRCPKCDVAWADEDQLRCACCAYLRR